MGIQIANSTIDMNSVFDISFTRQSGPSLQYGLTVRHEIPTKGVFGGKSTKITSRFASCPNSIPMAYKIISTLGRDMGLFQLNNEHLINLKMVTKASSYHISGSLGPEYVIALEYQAPFSDKTLTGLYRFSNNLHARDDAFRALGEALKQQKAGNP